MTSKLIKSLREKGLAVAIALMATFNPSAAVVAQPLETQSQMYWGGRKTEGARYITRYRLR